MESFMCMTYRELHGLLMNSMMKVFPQTELSFVHIIYISLWIWKTISVVDRKKRGGGESCHFCRTAEASVDKCIAVT